jgi:peptidoglycan/xylan/chitin deacetylase (PgdA/CDA1 family)
LNNNHQKCGVVSSSRCTEIIIILLLIIPTKSFPQTTLAKNNVIDNHGAIIRGDTTRKVLSLVFTGHEFADGGDVIQNVLKQNNIQAGFFFTGSFYSNKAFTSLIKSLKQDGHYLGAHSDKHLLYADWIKRDSLLVTKNEFTADLNQNYQRMRQFGIEKANAHFFLPPFEWYNSKIAAWTKELNLTLINFTPGTRSTADYTYPEMGLFVLSGSLIITF